MLRPTISLFTPSAIGDFKKTFHTLTKGMIASRFASQVFSTNIANQGVKNYKDRKVTQYATPNGPELGPLQEDLDPYYMSYEPNNPLADQNGYVTQRKDKTLENTVDLMAVFQSHNFATMAASILNKMNQATAKMDES